MDPRAKRIRNVSLLAVGMFVALGVGLVATGPKEKPGDEDPAPGFELETTIPDQHGALDLALYQSLGVELVPGHDLQLLMNGEVFDGIVGQIASAQSSIHILVYIWDAGAVSDRILGAIQERTQKGVACRVLVDAFGSEDFAEEIGPSLAELGCDVRQTRPLGSGNELARNHRKLVIVDGRKAITGGFGIADEWAGNGVDGESWRETNVAFAGPAVRQAQQAFAENWQEAGGALLPAEAFPKIAPAGPSRAAVVTSTASPVVTRAERLMHILLAAAKERIWIANAYFVPPQTLLDLMGKKATEGVDVRILAPGFKSDSKPSFAGQKLVYALMQEGVRVWEYKPSMMHAKTMVIDDRIAVVGSINFDPLSLSRLDEAALVVDDVRITKALTEAYLQDLAQSKELTTDQPPSDTDEAAQARVADPP